MLLAVGLGTLALLYLLLLWVAWRLAAERVASTVLVDPVTGLAAPAAFLERLAQTLTLSERLGGVTALAVLGIDLPAAGFRTRVRRKTLLRGLSDRLIQDLRQSDTLARVSDTELGILLPTVRDEEGALAAVSKLRRAANAVMAINALPADTALAFGVAISPAHGREPAELLAHARAALAKALAEGSRTVVYEDPEEQAAFDASQELRTALEDRQLMLFYQPRASLHDQRTHTVEALLRWAHPRRGLLVADEFLGEAARAGLMREVTMYVLEDAIRQLSQWRARGIDVRVAVNVSDDDLRDPSLVVGVATLLAKWNAEPDRLELEIPAHAMASDPGRTAVVVNALSNVGVRIAVDGFGTDEVPFVYLERLPLDTLKIDRSHVAGIRKTDAGVVSETIVTGRGLGVEVVAQGVETEEVRQRLIELDCDSVQGYLVGLPLPAHEVSLN